MDLSRKGLYDDAVVSHLSAYDRIVNPAQGKRVRKKKEKSAGGKVEVNGFLVRKEAVINLAALFLF